MSDTGVLFLFLAFFALASVVLFVWGLLQWLRRKELEDDFIEYRMQCTHAVVLYVEQARKNRALILLLNRLRTAVAESFFEGWNLTDVCAWCKKHDIPTVALLAFGNSDKIHVADMGKLLKEIEKAYGLPKTNVGTNSKSSDGVQQKA